MDLYTLKVYPQRRGREVYRVIKIMGEESLDRLCQEILNAFDFTNEHLYEFCMDNKMYSEDNYVLLPEYDDQLTTQETISSLCLNERQKFSLHYDFGDDWMFVITVQKIQETKEDIEPCVIKEKGSVEQYPNWDDDEEYYFE